MSKPVIVITILIVLFTAACGSTGGEISETLDFSYPDTDPAPVDLILGDGVLNINSGEAAGVTGSIMTNVSEWAPQFSEGEMLEIRQNSITRDVIRDGTNTWNVNLGTEQAIALNVSNGNAAVNFNLDGIQLASLSAEGSSGSYNLTSETPSPLIGVSASFTLTTGSMQLTNLLNSGMSLIETETTGGDQILIFDGETLREDVRVEASAGSGDITLRIDQDIPVQVIFRTTAGVVQQTDNQLFMDMGNRVYESESFADSEGSRLIVEILTVTGDLRLVGI